MTYPSNIPAEFGARIASVEPGSPAEVAGLAPGIKILFVQGEPLRDILDWHWLADDLEVELEVLPEGAEPLQASEDADDFEVEVYTLTREPGEPWGLSFTEVIFDGLRRCVNNCTFCFMQMLPQGMRSALYVKDDDYRLSFLHGNFITLTNLTNEDLERIVELQLSPLNVSLHAVDPAVRRQMIGKNEARGIEVLESLLEAGIRVKAQIVLMPGVNDGEVLEKTLDWIACRPGIEAVGIVPYGYTRFAKIQGGFDTAQSAREVIDQVAHRAPQVQLADEFFIKAWPGEILKHLPGASYYDGYAMLEDGIGMVRQFVDSPQAKKLFSGKLFEESLQGEELQGEQQSKASQSKAPSASHSENQAEMVITGEAFAAILQELYPEQSHNIFAIKNDFFGGNVDVAGLLTAEDIVRQAASCRGKQCLLPPVLFNDDGLTLDNKTAADIAEALGASVKVIDFT